MQKINAGGLTKGPAAVGGPCIGVYHNQQHFAYVDNRGTIWDSWWDGDANQWKLQQINAGGLTSGPASKPGFEGGDLGPVSIWVDPSNTQQHFTYLGTDFAVYDAFWDSNSNSWHLQKITDGGNTTGPSGGSSPFGCIFHQQQHIGYLDGNGNLWDSWYDGSGHWNLQKINQGGMTSGAQADLLNQPFIWVDNSNTQQHFTYRGVDGIYDAFWDSSGNSWHLQKINAGGNTTGPTATSMACACIFGQQQHIGYLDATGNIWDSWYDGAHWNLQKINTGGMTSGPAARILVFIWDAFNSSQQHFTYLDATGIIWDAFWVNPTQTSGGGGGGQSGDDDGDDGWDDDDDDGDDG